MKIETFYIHNCGWDYMVLNEEDFNTRGLTGYWFHTEAEAVADARACYPEVTEFALSDTNENRVFSLFSDHPSTGELRRQEGK